MEKTYNIFEHIVAHITHFLYHITSKKVMSHLRVVTFFVPKKRLAIKSTNLFKRKIMDFFMIFQKNFF